MLSVDLLLLVCLGYVAVLFALAFYIDRRARQGRINWLRSPIVFTLSISVYCTSWTFYGAVGSAARNGLEFITIYLGPTLVFVGWWWLLRKLVRVGRVHRITSIADLISSRYGKSSSLAVVVTLLAVTATTPYIALQLQSVTRSYQVIVGEADANTTALTIAAGMALFTILFGTRNLDANERHHGVVAAIAVEAIVKLVALIAVGVFAVFWLGGGVRSVFESVPVAAVHGGAQMFDGRWAALTFLSATAIICLPRQFQVTVVENVDERHLGTASWMFPLYLFGMCLFVMPIALVGLAVLPAGSNPDLFVLTLPLHHGRHELALLAFLGGFSSATSMVIVAAIAVSTMVSNHIVMPVALNFLSSGREVSGDVRKLVLTSRRVSIGLVLGLGFLYFRLSGGSDALAAIGLIAFVGVAQFLPSLLGAIFWRGATGSGALAGLVVGFVLWAYTLFLPSFAGELAGGADLLAHGPLGLTALRPQALLGLTGLDPLVHALVCSLGANVLVFLVVSVASEPKPLERLQGALFVDVFRSTPGEPPRFVEGQATSEDLFVLAQRILGTDPARSLFDEMAREQGASGLPAPSDAVIARLERELTGSIGAASAHAMVSRIAGRERPALNELIDIADETQRLIETSRQLSEKSAELELAASQLRQANERLRTLDAQKDEFLSQVSHELRTPMTSIRSFSEILLGENGVSEQERHRFVAIIHDESLRLTRLLDEILDISRLEAGSVDLPLEPVDAQQVIDAALGTVSGLLRSRGVALRCTPLPAGTMVRANGDRLRQALINLLSNAVKYNAAPHPEIRVHAALGPAHLDIDVIDNGGGVTPEEATTVFEKFNRGRRGDRDQGAGLGLPISRAIMRTMSGDLTVEFAPDRTSFFRLRLARAVVATGTAAASTH
ncbi:MAG: sodium:solute symporter [Ectothiorhodospiraceae bacterium]|nr:sodium:solute symporter [Ectothiorhodospiraceae bacterium]